MHHFIATASVYVGTAGRAGGQAGAKEKGSEDEDRR